jgi:RluA family pseudouridine synthase
MRQKNGSSSYWKLPLGISILFEDKDILVINKPEGLLSVAAGSERDRTAYWILCEYLRKRGEKRRVAAVHRLDRDTSGVMVFAKSGRVKRELMTDWNDRIVKREYVALAEGLISESPGTIAVPLSENGRGMMVAVPAGTAGSLEAVTHYRVLETDKRYTLVSLELETGRRNQIRAHLAWLGHPVAGDPKYGAKTNPLGRLGLHAKLLVLKHPSTGALMEFSVPVPPAFYRGLAL